MIIEFHDALVVGIQVSGPEVALQLERVCVYRGDVLVRQEGGLLLLSGVQDSRVDGETGALEPKFDYGRVLDWSLAHGAGNLLVQWVGHAPAQQHLSEWDFRYDASRWEPGFVHTD
jgi:hypothetical protein